ncbi:MAG TPA: AAA family ATPase [Anaerolineales bacterium]|nr:AAA family ATPase [Anaerolineales bacterium]
MAQRNKRGRRVVVGDVTGISGEVTIAAGDIYKGYTAEQVSLLLTQITSKFKPKPFDGRCPYKGLEVFEEEDADLFFGRERIVEDLLNRVKESRTVFITGPSGSGKSSLVRAGLLHSLKKGAVKGSERWLYETMKPGREPLKDLALAFSRLKSPELANYFQAHAHEIGVLHDCAESVLSGRKDQRFVLFVDQFEEVFTQVNNEQERLAFLNMLAHAGTLENGRVMVLFAMRSDFVSNCATYPTLNELLSHEFRQIGAMQPEELVSAIALPARHVGLPIEDELIARIINDMKGEPGALPLMQFALKDLFDSQQARGGVIALTLEDYLRHGGIHKSLERHADTSFARLSAGEQDLARSIFSGLIEIGRGTQDTRRTALFDELIPANAKPEEVESIVRKLADARLIITDEQAGKDTVTISHEKLIDAWPWLKKLVNENRDVIALQNEIASDAKEWEDHGRDPSYLYTGARLVNAREQLAAKKLVLSGLSQEFVQAGSVRQRRGQISLLASVSAIIVLLIVAVIVFSSQSAQNRALAEAAQAASTMAVAQQGTAEANMQLARESEEIAQAQRQLAYEQARLAHVRELAAQAALLRERRFQTSLLLGVEVFGLVDNPQTRGVLLDNVQDRPQLLRYLNGHNGAVNAVAIRPDGKMLASAGSDFTIVLWDLETLTPIGAPLQSGDVVNTVAFSPDGTMLASGSQSNGVTLWDVDTHEPIAQLLDENSDFAGSVAFSPDGRTLLAGDWYPTLWDIATQQQIGEPSEPFINTITSLTFGPDGRMFATGNMDGTILLWDAITGQPATLALAGHTGPVTSLSFSPDGSLLASGSNDNTILLWDVSTQQLVGEPLEGHASQVSGLAFGSDGSMLISASWDGTIRHWDVGIRQPVGEVLSGQSDRLFDLALSPDGSLLASASADGTVALWQSNQTNAIGMPLRGQLGRIGSVAFSPDGKTLASGSYRGTIFFWDAGAGQATGEPISGDPGQITSVAFHPAGSILASGSTDSTVTLWDVHTYQRIGEPLIAHAGAVRSIAFRPDGRLLASASEDDTVILWDLETHELVGSPFDTRPDRANTVIRSLISIALSPDGNLLAVGYADGMIYLWDLHTREQIGEPLTGHTGPVQSVAFSPDGNILASGSEDNTVILWDIETHQPIGQPLTGHSGAVNSVAFHPNGDLLASSGFDATILLWDVATGLPTGDGLRGHTGSVYSLQFSPDGGLLASGSVDNTVRLWNMDPRLWIDKACERAGRNFTKAEWAQFFGEGDYHKTCEQWPLAADIAVEPSPTP